LEHFDSFLVVIQVKMGIINLQNSSALCLVDSSHSNLQQRRKFVTMASSMIPPSSVEQVNNGPLQVTTTGDSFIRQHLRKLAPYQPILPFEVCCFLKLNPILSFAQWIM